MKPIEPFEMSCSIKCGEHLHWIDYYQLGIQFFCFIRLSSRVIDNRLCKERATLIFRVCGVIQ
jgi:hypothetical protein